jgi:hypothetical protein
MCPPPCRITSRIWNASIASGSGGRRASAWGLILAVFAVFEKRRNDVLHVVVEQIK